MNDTPPAAAEYLLARVTKSRALSYAVRCADTASIRGKDFWLLVAEIVRNAKERRTPMYVVKQESGACNDRQS